MSQIFRPLLLSFSLVVFVLIPLAAIHAQDGGTGPNFNFFGPIFTEGMCQDVKDEGGIIVAEDVCTACDIFKLSTNILNFAWSVAVTVATLMIAYGGFLIIIPYASGGVSSEALKKGKTVITTALVGILIAFFAWLGIDTIIKLLGQQSIGSQTPGTLFPSISYGPWNKIECETPDLTVGGTVGGDGNGDIDDITTTEEVEEWQLALPPEGTGLRPTEDLVCDASGLALYNDKITEEAEKNGVSPNRIKAIILTESGGNTAAISNDNDGKHSYGVMQVRPETARDLDPSLAGVSDTAVGNSLNLDQNRSIELGTQYYAGQLAKNNGNHNLAAAGYNGGPAANNESVNCAGNPSPNGGTMRRWECPVDNGGVPNTGYQVTRNYVDRVNAFEAALDAGTCGP